MKKGKIAAWAVAVATSAAISAMAATVTVNAPAGTSTNVTQVFMGDTSVTVNTGSTGGTVRLSPYSQHTGGTTLSSGTLDVQQESQLGGSLTLRGGNFHYTGPSGAVWTTAITNSAPNATVSQNWRIDNDLTMAGSIWSTDGLFVKTGPGTLTLTTPFYLGAETSNLGTRDTLINLSDAAAPTKGLSGATFGEGTVVVDTPYDEAVTNKFSECSNTSIIAVRTTNAVNEAALIISNGITRMHAALVVGAGYGKGDAGGSFVKGTLKVPGGELVVGNPSSLSILYTCVNNVPDDMRVEGVVDISTSQKVICKGYYPCNNANTLSTTIVHDGGFLSNYDGNIQSGNGTSNAATTNNFVITGSGTLVACSNFRNDVQGGGMTTNLRLADGAVLEMRNFVNSASGIFNVVFDGGIWRHRNHNNATPHFPSSMTSMKIGPGGLITFFNNGNEAYPVIWDKGLEPLDDSGTDGGVSISQGSSGMPPLVIRGVNTYCGPTYISFTRVYLGGAGRLPAGTALTVTGDRGGLIVTNGVQTVGSFTFGTAGTTYSPILGFDRESRLDVTGDVVAGSLGVPKLHLFETRGMTNLVANGMTTPGVYTLVTASAASLDALQRMAQAFYFPYQPADVAYTCSAVVEEGRAKLKVTVSSASGATLSLPSTGTTPLSPTADQLAAATLILANPQAAGSGAGTVELGALDGFAAGGRLVAGSGTTRASDLSFVQSIYDLVLSTGTFAYTGPTAEIPGFTVDGNTSRSAVLSVVDANTTLSVSGVSSRAGAFTKMGAGTLHIKGTGDFLWRTDHVDYHTTIESGVAPNGDGPSRGFRAFNVNEGAVTIGTLGDPTDAPHVDVPYEISVGSRSHQAGQGVQTAGTMTLDNGTLAASNTLMIGYYSGNPNDQPDTILYPTFTMNGGEAYLGTLRLGHGGSSLQTDSPSYIQHGGTNIVAGTVYIGYQAVPKKGVYRATFLVDGGYLSCGGNIYAGNANNTMGADLIITNGGTVVVNNGKSLSLNHANTRETNTLVLASGGTLRSSYLITDSASLAYPAVAYFDGGIFQPVLIANTTTYLRYLSHAYLGANGLTVDLSHQSDYDGTKNRWMTIWQTFEPDPALPEGVPDGGITFTGKGTIATWSTFGNGTFTGGIHVRDGARYLIAGDGATPFAADFAPGTIVSSYNATNTIGSLTLGTAGATDPVTFEVSVDLPGAVGVVVADTLSVLSPVAVTTRDGTFDFDCIPRIGTYTALVYNASNADVDTSLFQLPAQGRFTLTARNETITGGDLDGMKAVVVTIASASNAATGCPVWTSVSSGGAWADSANWNNATVPSGPNARAGFNPATKANVSVTLSGDVTVGTLDFAASSAKNGYKLSGGSITMGEAGHFAWIVNSSGTNTVDSPVTLAGKTFADTTAGNELRLTGGVSGAADLGVNTLTATGAGQVNLKVSQGYTGKVTTGSGRVVMDDLSFIQSPDQLTLGLGTFLYTGPDVEIPGFQFTAASGRPAVFQSDANVTANAITLTGTSAFLKLGTGTLHLNGTGTLAVNTKTDNVGTGSSTVAKNGDGPTKAVRGFTVSDGTFEMGEVNDPDNAPTVSETGSYEITVGSYTSSSGDAAFVLNNGTCSTAAGFYLGYYSYPSANMMLTYRQNGGSLQANNFYCWYYNKDKSRQKTSSLIEINGGSAYVKNDLIMGRTTAFDQANQTCRFVMNGGSFATGRHLYLAFSNSANRACIDLNGGVLTCSNTLYAAYLDGNDVTVRMNPGSMFRCNAYSATVGDSVTRLYGNGGEFRPLCRTAAAQTMAAGTFTHLYASTNGFVVDTSETLNGAPFTLAQAVETDPALNGGMDGGLVKRGTGVLALSSSNNTFTGPARVEGGVLRADVANALANAVVELAGGGFVVGCGTATVGGLGGGGLVQGGDLVVTGALAPAADRDGYFHLTGALTVAAGAVLDVSAFEDGSLAPGDTLYLAAVEGPVTVPPTLRVRPASKLTQSGLTGKTSVADGLLFVRISTSGAAIIIR